MINDVNINNQPITTIKKEVNITKLQNQKAIEYLTKVQIFISDNAVYAEDDVFGREINNFIDNKIKELEEEE